MPTIPTNVKAAKSKARTKDLEANTLLTKLMTLVELLPKVDEPEKIVVNRKIAELVRKL